MFSRKIFLLIAIIAVTASLCAQEFKASQLQNGRVQKAYEERGADIIGLIESRGLDTNSLHIFIRAFKHESKMEIWGRDSLHEQFVLLKEYRICRISGEVGPKRKQVDRQIPEGCYHIDSFNPWSHFYLSLGINYPNASDKILADKNRPGGEIFIHGSCVTIGCLPMTDDHIKEIYIFAVEARNNGQQYIPIHIFPCLMDGEYYSHLKENFTEDEDLLGFWNNMEEAFLYFEMNKTLPEFSVNAKGEYCFE
jgi:murein L,D-transpeptidase YafK